jgi:hypothetical protein
MQISSVRAGAAQMFDEFCGTKPRPLPWPGPKGPKSSFDAISNILNKVGLNPQPLPPKELDGGWCGTVPRKPPLPDPPPFNLLNFSLRLR